MLHSGSPLKKSGIVGGGIHFGINSLTQPFFALYAAELGASTAMVGVMITFRAMLPLLIAMPSGQLIDRLGAPHMLRLGNMTTILSLILMVWSPNLFILALSQFLMGAGTMVMVSSLQVIVSEGDRAERERDITRYSAWCSAGSMVGPLVGGAIITAVAVVHGPGWWGTAALMGYKAAFALSAILAIGFAFWFHIASRQKEKKSWFGKEFKEVMRPREMADSYLKGAHLLKHPGVQFGLAGTFLIHFIQSIWMGFFPLYLDSLGYSAFLISILVSIRGLAGLISRTFLGQLIKRFSHHSILISAGCLAALCLISLPVMDWHVAMIAVVSFILGSAVGVNMPVSTMIMVDDDLASERGKVMGLRLLANRSSQIAAPMLFGVVGQWLGLALAFYTGGGVLLASMLGFSLYHRLRSAKALPKGEGVSSQSGV